MIVSPPVKKEAVKFKLPSKNDNMRRVYAYLLNRRGVDKEVLYAFTNRQMIYESADYHNAVFVGYDSKGNPRHANLRGTGLESTFKGNMPGSVPEYSFHWHGTSECLCLFEAPIDMLSFISMHKNHWQSHSYAASCCVSDKVLFQCLKDNPKIEKVFLCFDSDAPGQKAAQRISGKLSERNIQSQILAPAYKDWNEDLLCSNEETEEEKTCQTLQP